MIRIVNIGMNHDTAPVELRECLAKDPAHTDRALAMMRELSFVKEGMFLSTCNRVEALFTTEQTEEAKSSIVSVLSELGGMPSESLCSSLFTYEDRDAVRHIFRVASSSTPW
jgi:glutamyl-tRNA reductase